MTDNDIHPDSGADEDAKIWADLEKAEAAQAVEPEPKEPDPAPAAVAPAEGSQPAEKPAGQPAGTAEAAPATTPDIWEKATPEQRAAYEATRKQLDTISENNRRFAGTVSGLQRQVDALLKKAPDKSKAAATVLDDPDFKKAEQEYPEVIGPLKKTLQALEQRTGNAERALEGMSAEARGRQINEQLGYVISQHSDYASIKGSKEFRDWFAQAPAYVQDGVKRNAKEIVDGHEVADIVARFKTETGFGSQPTPSPAADPAPGTQKPAAQSDKRKAQLESAAAPRGRGPAPQTGTPESEEDWWAHYDEQDRKAARR